MVAIIQFSSTTEKAFFKESFYVTVSNTLFGSKWSSSVVSKFQCLINNSEVKMKHFKIKVLLAWQTVPTSNYIFIFPQYPYLNLSSETVVLFTVVSVGEQSSSGLHTLCTDCLMPNLPVNVNFITFGFLELVLIWFRILKKGLQRLFHMVLCFSLYLIYRGLIKNLLIKEKGAFQRCWVFLKP